MAPSPRYSRSLRDEIFLVGAAALILALACCGQADPVDPGEEAAQVSPCVSGRAPTVCTTDDAGELRCSGGRDE